LAQGKKSPGIHQVGSNVDKTGDVDNAEEERKSVAPAGTLMKIPCWLSLLPVHLEWLNNRSLMLAVITVISLLYLIEFMSLTYCDAV
jgi:hypothetical protein